MWSAKYLIMMEGPPGNMENMENVDSVDSEKVVPDIIEADETSPLLKRPSNSESDGGSTHYSRHRRLYIFLLSFLASSLFIGIIFTVVLCSAPSVPQPVVQSRKRPLLGPSPG